MPKKIREIEQKSKPKREQNLKPEIWSEEDPVFEILDNIVVVDNFQPYSIGVLNDNNIFKKFIFRNKRLPQENTFIFSTNQDNQETATFQILIGENENNPVNIEKGTHLLLNEFTLKPLPHRKSGEIMIKLHMSIDIEGLLQVTAICTDNCSELINQSMKINTKSILSDENIKEALDNFELHAQYKEYLDILKKKIKKLKDDGKYARKIQTFYMNLVENNPLDNIDIRNRINKIFTALNNIKD